MGFARPVPVMNSISDTGSHKSIIMKIIKEVKISDNGFVFNSNTGDSFSLNPSGLELIKLISEGKDFGEVYEAFALRYEIDELTFEKDFYEFCSLLKHHQIILQGNPLEFN
jgi:hypothetical protein